MPEAKRNATAPNELDGYPQWHRARTIVISRPESPEAALATPAEVYTRSPKEEQVLCRAHLWLSGR